MAKGELLLDNIESIELSSREEEEGGLLRKLSPLGKLDNNNVLIRLKEEQEVEGPCGFKRRVKMLLIFVDQKQDFHNSINALLND